jgi:hypothetical protein
MAYDNPPGANTFRYVIGWNLETNGQTYKWSEPIEVSGVGDDAEGAGVTLAHLDGNRRPELILMAYDNPTGANTFRYRIGWNLGHDGQAASWTDCIIRHGVGNDGQGAGVLAFPFSSSGSVAELFLMAYDNPAGSNWFRYRHCKWEDAQKSEQ